MKKFTEQFRSDYVVVDLETTGLSPDSDAIIEIAAVKVIGDKATDTFSTLVNPHRHISSMITALTGISDDMTADAPDIDTAMAMFLDFVGDMPLLGHNLIRFDLCFLKKQADMDNFCIDTLNLAQHMKTGSRGYSLSALCDNFGIVNDNAHRALSDCMATFELYLALKECYRKNGAFFNMSAVCGKKEYQMNISEKCRVGTELTYTIADSGEAVLYAGGCPVGTVSEGKKRELQDNSGLIGRIVVSKISEGAKGKLLMGTEVILLG